MQLQNNLSARRSKNEEITTIRMLLYIVIDSWTNVDPALVNQVGKIAVTNLFAGKEQEFVADHGIKL